MQFSALLLTALSLVATAAASCGDALPSSPTPGGSSELRYITSGGISRTYRLYLPEGYTNNDAAPLIFSFHGNGGNATKQEQISKFSEPEFNTKYVVVYGNGAKNDKGSRSWEGASYSNEGVSDVQYTADVLAAVEEELCIDSDRVYANGKSNGGGFVGLLSCSSTLAPKFAAFAAVSGAFYTGTHEPCNPGGVRPFMEFHGMADNVIPYIGGEKKGGTLGRVDDYMQTKAELNGCADGEGPDVTAKGAAEGEVWRREWKCGGDKNVVVHYNETVLAHSWPGTEQTQPENELVYATQPILDFFELWS
ncbi:putative ferulic acid esterase [Geopyxis carbonaria]|nr:putative ferulic acid esterase [Geopyxis carbonaria]